MARSGRSASTRTRATTATDGREEQHREHQADDVDPADVRAAAHGHAPLTEPHQRQRRRQPERDLPGNDAAARRAANGVAGRDPDRDHRGDDERREQQGDGTHPRGSHDGARGSSVGDGPSHDDERVREQDACRRCRASSAMASSSTAFNATAAGDNPRTVSSATSRRRRSNQSRRGRRHEAGTGQRGEHGDRPHAAADRRLDGAGPIGDERQRGAEVALDERGRVRRLDLAVVQRRGRDRVAAHERPAAVAPARSAASSPSHASSSTRPRVSVTVTSSRSGASHAASATAVERPFEAEEGLAVGDHDRWWWHESGPWRTRSGRWAHQNRSAMFPPAMSR